LSAGMCCVYYLFFTDRDAGKALLREWEEITVERFFREVEEVQEPSRGLIKEDRASS